MPSRYAPKSRRRITVSLGEELKRSERKLRPQSRQALRSDRTCVESKHVALCVPSLAGGGAERVTLNLAGAFCARGHRVDLIVCRAEGELRDQVPDGVTLVELRRGRSRGRRYRPPSPPAPHPPPPTLPPHTPQP